ncbi:MAG TPA: hypothetical protein VK595_16615 [Vicinamibacterales bacterium]|nr:hypothetical protein [Vicinamibacterales bacterium]
MNKISSMTVAAAALVVCLFAAREADACACPAVPPADPSGNYTDGDNELRTLVEDALKHASAVFTGEAVSGDIFGTTLRVEKVWKGPIGDRVVMQYAAKTAEGPAISSCVFHFPVGHRYLVFAFAEPGGMMVAGSCGPSGSIDSVGKTLHILGPPLERRDDRKGPDVKSP